MIHKWLIFLTYKEFLQIWISKDKTYRLVKIWAKQSREEKGEEERKKIGKGRGQVEWKRTQNKKMSLKH